MEICSWKDLENFCINAANDLNEMFNTCQDLMRLSPFTVSGGGSSVNNIIDTVIGAVSGTAMTLCVLFFLIDFAKKSLDLQWVKWENVFLFLLKLIFAKVVVENSREIMEFIFSAFTGLTNNIQDEISKTLGLGNTFLDPNKGAGLFLTEAEIELFDGDGIGDSGVWFGLDRLMKEIELMPSIFIAKGIIVVTAIMIFARMFEIMVYTMVSPIPLSTFANDEHRQIGIGFVKSYAAVCLQGLMIIVMFYTFSVMGDFIDSLDGTWLSGSFGILIRTLVLGLGIFKSGSWAKKLCGAM